MAIAFQATLVDQPASTHAFDLLEDGSCAGVELEPGVTGAAPAQVFLHDAMHRGRIAPFELKGYCKRNVIAMMEHARVVPELHVVGTHRLSLVFLSEELAGVKDVRNEHRFLSLGLRLEKMKVLPDSPADCTRNSDVVLESRPATFYSFGNQLTDDSAALNAQQARVRKGEVTRTVPDDQSPKAMVSDKDVGPEPEDEVRNLQLTRGQHGGSQVIRSLCRIKEISWTANAESGVWSEQLIASEL